ncbi:hypothetical protein NJ7G_4172 [Natrinema sp. J7-2]|nr:hypothetical protein NJ7G_4172 [Natrinema sp. J7-2]
MVDQGCEVAAIHTRADSPDGQKAARSSSTGIVRDRPRVALWLLSARRETASNRGRVRSVP